MGNGYCYSELPGNRDAPCTKWNAALTLARVVKPTSVSCEHLATSNILYRKN